MFLNEVKECNVRSRDCLLDIWGILAIMYIHQGDKEQCKAGEICSKHNG